MLNISCKKIIEFTGNHIFSFFTFALENIILNEKNYPSNNRLITQDGCLVFCPELKFSSN